MNPAHPVHDAGQVIARLEGLPGGPELLAQARMRQDVALVGGAVRDLLLGHWPNELDVTVAADGAGLAQALAEAISPSERAYGRAAERVVHERFGTASVAWGYGRVDVAERRAESYPSPGALPEVRPGSFEEDLRRRDFTVNAIALPLAGRDSEGLIAVEHALEDLRAGRLRVLHDASFRDDPTRILRLARYAARLGFEIEPHTRELAAAAVAADALATVSGGRIGAELWLAVKEASAAGALAVLDELGVLAALEIPSPFDAGLAAQAQALLPADGRRELLLMGVAMRPPGADAGGSVVAILRSADALEFTREETQAVVAVAAAAGTAAVLGGAPRPAAAYAALDGLTPEAAAVAGALAERDFGQAGALAREWLAVQRHVRLEIDGNDLLAAGIPEGPEIGARLHAALARKREGEVAGREQELQAALEAEIGWGTPIET